MNISDFFFLCFLSNFLFQLCFALICCSFLVVGHYQTFFIAWRRCRASGADSKLILRMEDLDRPRCKAQYYQDLIEDLEWLGLDWNDYADDREGVAGSVSVSSESPGPRLRPCRSEQRCVRQIDRMARYVAAWQKLLRGGFIYPSPHSRKDVESAISAPHEGDVEVIFPPSLRPDYMAAPSFPPPSMTNSHYPPHLQELSSPSDVVLVNWRFRVPDGELIQFVDERFGPQEFRALEHFGDFVIWRGSDNIPSYELAVVVDDIDMHVTEVVRGQDLLLSTARQILLYRALGCADALPRFYHTPLVRNAEGVRLAKRSLSQSIRNLRESGYTPRRIREEFFDRQIQEEFS